MVHIGEIEKTIIPTKLYLNGILGTLLSFIGIFLFFKMEISTLTLPSSIYGIPIWVIGFLMSISGACILVLLFKEYKTIKKESFLNTQQIVIIALLSALGGTLSSFVSYLGLQLNYLIGVSEGAGQILGGAHVYWLLLIAVLVPRRGAVTYAGFIKGIVELFTGSPHGVLVVLITIAQGFSIDMVFLILTKLKRETYTISSLSIAASLGCIANIIVAQALFYHGLPMLFLVIMAITATISGVIFGGFLANDTLNILQEAGLWNLQRSTLEVFKIKKPTFSVIWKSPKHVTTSAFILIFITIGSLFALSTIYGATNSPYSCNIVGNVENPFTFVYSDFETNEVTIEAKLDGASTHLQAANYTGIILRDIIMEARPKNDASLVIVRARDYYEARFNLNDVLNDERMIISIDENKNWLWLIAGDYEGAYWVKIVSNIIIE